MKSKLTEGRIKLIVTQISSESLIGIVTLLINGKYKPSKLKVYSKLLDQFFWLNMENTTRFIINRDIGNDLFLVDENGFFLCSFKLEDLVNEFILSIDINRNLIGNLLGLNHIQDYTTCFTVEHLNVNHGMTICPIKTKIKIEDKSIFYFQIVTDSNEVNIYDKKFGSEIYSNKVKISKKAVLVEFFLISESIRCFELTIAIGSSERKFTLKDPIEKDYAVTLSTNDYIYIRDFRSCDIIKSKLHIFDTSLGNTMTGCQSPKIRSIIYYGEGKFIYVPFIYETNILQFETSLPNLLSESNSPSINAWSPDINVNFTKLASSLNKMGPVEFCTGLYRYILNREPDEGGLLSISLSCKEQIEAFGFEQTAKNLWKSFTCSDEFTSNRFRVLTSGKLNQIFGI